MTLTGQLHHDIPLILDGSLLGVLQHKVLPNHLEGHELTRSPVPYKPHPREPTHSDALQEVETTQAQGFIGLVRVHCS
jgi:hypothetical protein